MSSTTKNVTSCTHGKYVDQQNICVKPINNCDGPIDSFTGRSTELSDLRSNFNKHNIVVIHGVGGVGKTQLARKFVADNKNNYNCLFWLQAEFQENLIKQLRQLALELDIKDGMNRNINQIRNEIYNILKTQRALLIFDNVLNEVDIKKYLPPVTEIQNTKLDILITSQFLDWDQKTVKCLPLIHIEEFYALELLNKILNTNRVNAKDRKTLVHLLDYMPLSIQIAASYINTQMKQNDAFTITRYTEKLTNDIANIHKHKHIEYGKTLGMSIKMSLDIIREDNAYAMELVYILAFFNPDSITKEVLSKILKINNNDAKDDFCEALVIIINYSLISSFDNRIYLHRNIQNIIRDNLTQLETHIFLKYYKLVLDYVLNNEDQNSIRNTYVFKYAKDYTKFILQYYKVSKSAKLLQLLCKHACFKNLEVIFAPLNEVNFLIERHGLLHYATLSSDVETVKIICKYNIDINIKYGTNNTTALHIACKHGYADIADFLIEKGADINMKCENGRMALHYASIGLHYDIVHRVLCISPNTVEERDKKNQTPLQLVLNTHKTNENNDKTVQTARLLVENGAYPGTANDESYKVIHIAAHNGNYDFLAYLLANFELDVNAKNIHGNTPLFYAVAANKFIPDYHIMNTIKLLIKNGARVETNNNSDCSVLHVAAEYCRDQIISYLIQEHNVSVDTRDSLGQTPLFYALLANKSISEDDVMATVKLLIENGASVETINNDGCNLLHVASQYCHDKIISYLIQEHNISVRTPDSSGWTPLFYALLADKSISEDDVMTTVTLLIENGASVEMNNGGFSLLHAASQYCHGQIISCLIQDHNISVDILDSLGRTPLFYALLANKSISEHDVMATVKLLIENGANAETITNDGCSLLHVAAEYCHDQIISCLIQELNISVDILDSLGRTPLFYALLANKSKSKHDVMATVKLLIENGANAETITYDGCSLLHVAAVYCHDQIFTCLIQEHNISVDTLDSLGRTPLFYALLANKSISEHDVMATVKLLIENDANAEIITNDGCSLLHVAAEYCHGQFISCLIQEHNISVDIIDSLGRTPLFYALLANKSISEHDIMATVKLLIENNANAEIITNDGCSLLHVAAEYCHGQIISYLIQEHEISIHKIDSYGRTPLFCAIRADKSISEDDVMATVKLLIENGASVETTNNDGCNLLHVASQYCHDKIISYLIQEHNISVRTPDSSGWTPLFYALLADKSISEDDVMTTVALLTENGARIEMNNDGCSLLHAASQYCHGQFISCLIQDHNISVDILDYLGRTPLFYALLANKSISEHDVMATVKLLIENGANAETITNDGCSLLHVAAEYCHGQIISYLIQEHKISVHKIDSYGRTPLFCAIRADKSISEDDVMATVKLLIENGASVETTNNDGCNLLHVASQYCHNQIISYLNHEHNISVHMPDSSGWTPLFYALLADKSISEDDVMATVKLLIENGASLEETNNRGCSLLHAASQYCHDQIISCLIQEHNISVDILDSLGRTPLFYALLANKPISEDDVTETIKLLIVREATVEATDNTGCTILHYAAHSGRYQALTYLLHNYNLNINTKDEDGNTPLHCALVSDESINQETVKKIIEILLFNGASINLKNNKEQTALDLASPEVRKIILKSYAEASKRGIPESTQQ